MLYHSINENSNTAEKTCCQVFPSPRCGYDMAENKKMRFGQIFR